MFFRRYAMCRQGTETICAGIGVVFWVTPPLVHLFRKVPWMRSMRWVVLRCSVIGCFVLCEAAAI